MNDEKQFENLNDEELREFLHIIESDNDSILEAEEEASKNIIDEEECLPDEMLSDNAWKASLQWEKTENGKYVFAGVNYNLKSVYDEEKKKIQELNRKKGPEFSSTAAAKRRQRKIEINRAAFNQQDIHISDKIGQELLKQLIVSLVKPHTDMINKLDEFINKRFALLLRPLIPNILKQCAKQYPNSVMKCQGFFYIASEEYGGRQKFWATPDIPYFFTQGTEQDILKKHRSKYLYNIDKAIAQYNYHITEKNKKEVKYATALVNRNVQTYYDLIKYSPFWFEKIYEIVTQKQLAL